jgi:DnaD/phage-associated family protein
MPNRILKDSICTSPNIDALSREAEAFFYRLLVQCDDFGRMDARPAILRARCYPLRLDAVTDKNVSTWLGELVRADLVLLYSVEDRPYLQMRTWERHQQVRAKRSKYPDPITFASNCNQVQSNVPEYEYESGIQSESNPVVVVVAPPPPAEPAQAEPTPAAPTKDAATAAVFRCWQDNIPGTLTTVIADDLGDLIDTYGPDAVTRAIGESARANIRTMRYISGILKNWAAGSGKPSQNGHNGRAGPVTNGNSKAERSHAAVEAVRQMYQQQKEVHQ